jgi:hypothetical protein
VLPAAVAKRHRAELLRAVERERKKKNRARVLELRAEVRKLRHERAAMIRAALKACRARRPPTTKQMVSWHREAQKRARGACAADFASARAMRGKVERARGELLAEKKYQRELRRIEAGNRSKLKARPPAKVRSQETDQEVLGNIPPELAALFQRVKRSIRGSDRKSRTEAFLEYAESHPDEEWQALEDRTDEVIRELERRQAMANPKKKKKHKRASKKNPPRLTAAQSRKRFADLKKAGCKPKRVRLGGESVVVRRRACSPPPMPNPRRPPKRWFDRCLRSVAAKKYARDPAAVCAAAWWRRPPAERDRIVRRLERGSPRERRTAVAIAKAEARRADGPPRKGNPGMTDAEARAEYARTHWGEKGHGRVRRGRAADPRRGTATQLGKLVAVVYRTQKKGDGRPVDYEHAFEGRRPRLLYNEGGLFIEGGDYVVKTGGITG